MYHNKERTRQLGWVRKKGGVWDVLFFLVLIKSRIAVEMWIDVRKVKYVGKKWIIQVEGLT